MIWKAFYDYPDPPITTEGRTASGGTGNADLRSIYKKIPH